MYETNFIRLIWNFVSYQKSGIRMFLGIQVFSLCQASSLLKGAHCTRIAFKHCWSMHVCYRGKINGTGCLPVYPPLSVPFSLSSEGKKKQWITGTTPTVQWMHALFAITVYYERKKRTGSDINERSYFCDADCNQPGKLLPLGWAELNNWIGMFIQKI